MKKKNSQPDKIVIDKLTKAQALDKLGYMYNTAMSCNSPECKNKINVLEYYRAYAEVKQYIQDKE